MCKLLKLKKFRKKLIGSEDFNDAYFNKIDEIDYMIIEGKNLKNIIQKFNLEKPRLITLNESGKDINLKSINYISKDLAKSIFNVSDIDSISLIESNSLKSGKCFNKLGNSERKDERWYSELKRTRSQVKADVKLIKP